MKEVADVKELLLRTLEDLKAKRRPERKRRLENKITNLAPEKQTLKNQKNEFVIQCNELSKVYEDKNKLEHKMSNMRRRLRRMLKHGGELGTVEGDRVLRLAHSVLAEHNDMISTTEAYEKGRWAAMNELAKYLVEVACLLDAEVKLRGFEELIDQWREQYNIEFDSEQYATQLSLSYYDSNVDFTSNYDYDYYTGDYYYGSEYSGYEYSTGSRSYSYYSYSSASDDGNNGNAKTKSSNKDVPASDRSVSASADDDAKQPRGRKAENDEEDDADNVNDESAYSYSYSYSDSSQ